MPGSGPRRHDARQRLIAPLDRRGNDQIATAIVGPTPTTPTSAAPTQAATQPNPHRRQTDHPAPAGSFLGGFRTPAAAPVDSSRPAGIRNPTPRTPAAAPVD